MDINTISQLISQVGFPIFACCAMGYYVYYSNNKSRQEIQRINDQHKAEMDQVTQALNNNTLAITKLCDKIGG